MGIYQIVRPVIVDAVQCTEAKTIATDLGFINVKPGEWVVCGEGGECYVVDDAFFRRTFISVNSESSGAQSDNPRTALFSLQHERTGSQIPPWTNFRKDRVRLALRRAYSRRHRLGSHQ